MTHNSQEALLEIRELHKNYGAQPVLSDISLSVKKGEVVVILGPSGCGKSTLLRCINGLEEIQAGKIFLNNIEISNAGTQWHLIRQKVGMVFQSYDLFPHMTILDNILLGPVKVQKRNKQEARKQAEKLLDRVGLLEKINAYPRQLSGGQKQRVAIVRALCLNPEIILFDEVTAALDPEVVHEVLKVMLELANEGMTMIIVTHEMDFAKAVADKIVFMDQGEIKEIASPSDFFKEPSTERGKQFINMFNYNNFVKEREK
ncbi:amino acid ABC transporter ATP-binding protein [Amphibacillus sp. MSJ-3]|uniref:amino acid ABC transporter ATP-binding protein n=1 Tax=Amphibacillus sp. MSJ-3 TaxID=2841505 RepID=UPI001C0F371E|nr:amino acid ABC transporter ATP-binding protein [Amphibacillus sp. MSJ-3]MBU5595483.1 amino acid ABC transporter ATP-binding protein [Amphibacillus sp. MSJ-3]